MIDRDLLELLVCPACGQGAGLTPTADGEGLLCARCGRCYPIRDGIPILLIEEARIPPGPAGSRSSSTGNG
ncbi:MAG: Trm112 family protein [Lentisphaeria bacterium]|nr:Trm112 family protein [Lentisphaeria bacterium]